MDTSTPQNPVDFEDQQNEFLVLESILDKEQFVFNGLTTSDLPSGQIQVRSRVTELFEVVSMENGLFLNLSG